MVAAPLAGCFSAPPVLPYTFTLADGEGTNVTIPLEVKRIISLTPSHTEVVFALGAGSRVVGVTDFDFYPPEAASITKVLVNLTVNFEIVAQQDPDLILVSSLNNRADIDKLRDLDYAVFYADALAVRDVPPMIRLLGKAIRMEENGTRVADDLQASINATALAAANATARPRTFYLLDDFQGWWTAGDGTRGDDLIEVSGGTNVFGNVTGWAAVSIEAIAASNPEVIIVGLYVSLDISSLNSTSPWSSMPAVQQGRVYRVPDADIVDRPGPRLSAGLAWMLGAIHPEL
jgi:iron complex transport system substrate-binding protein